MKYFLIVTLLLGVTLLVPSCATQEVSSSSEISSATSLSVDEKANEDIIGELVEQLKDIFN